ncbi:MAG: TetR/AcrR family transcriptional regulator [Candidatus Thorarchaeota archaeon]|jgi:AcrR family transcriptional regulator
MRKSKAKQSIVQTAQKLIDKKGYSKLNVNEVAYVAKVSVGTLYYHFPSGKVDILAEIMSQKTEGYVEWFNQQIGVEKLKEKGLNLEDSLRWIFKKVIELRRTDRQFLSAIQSEMFSNPDDYLDLVEKYQSTDGLRQAIGILSEIMMETAKSEAKSLDKMGDKQDRMQRVVGLLMTYQIIFPGYFGDDDDFVDLALSLFLEILKS